jgi:hypothetical protein
MTVIPPDEPFPGAASGITIRGHVPMLGTEHSEKLAAKILENVWQVTREKAADAIHLAEQRGIEAAFAALNEVTGGFIERDAGRFSLLIGGQAVDPRLFRDSLESHLGRRP